jgi:flagellin
MAFLPLHVQGHPMNTINNLDSLRALAGLSQANTKVSQASERISTGLRINRASDDVGGMAVANGLKTQIGSFNKVLDNVSQGSTVTQLVDTSLSQIVDILSYMRVAAVASQSDTLSAAQRTAYQSEMDAYATSIDTIASNSTWNGTSLMTTASTMNIQTGVNSGNTTTLSFDQTTSTSLAVDSLSTTSTATAGVAVTAIDTALSTVNTYQSYIGSMANVMDAQYDVATSAITNYSSSYGTIMNADYAAETANLASAQIQRDGATAMLVQGNGLNRSLVDYLLSSAAS